MRLEAPIASNGTSYAILRLRKPIEKDTDDRFVLNRIEHLRRTLAGTMEKLAIRSLTCPEVFEERRHPDNHTAGAWDGPERRSLPHPPQ
jgi:hypothetical protein